MTEPEKHEERDNSRRDSSSAVSPKSSRFKELLDQISENIDKETRDTSANSDTSRFDSLLDQIGEDRSEQSDKESTRDSQG